MSARSFSGCGFPAAHLIAAASTTVALLCAAPVAARVFEAPLTSVQSRSASLARDVDLTQPSDVAPNGGTAGPTGCFI